MIFHCCGRSKLIILPDITGLSILHFALVIFIVYSVERSLFV